MKLNLKTDLEYRQYPAESYSSLKHLLVSPTEYLKQKETPFTGNRSTNFGTACHHILQRNKHLVRLYEDDEQLNDPDLPEGTVFVDDEEMDKLKVIVKNFKANKEAVKLIKGVEFETPYVMDYLPGLSIKGKLDFLKKSSHFGDFKTTAKKTDREDFKKTISYWHYDLQAYLYQTLIAEYDRVTKELGKYLPGYFIVCSVKDCQVEVYPISQHSIDIGSVKADICSERYIKFIKDSMVWEGSQEQREV